MANTYKNNLHSGDYELKIYENTKYNNSYLGSVYFFINEELTTDEILSILESEMNSIIKRTKRDMSKIEIKIFEKDN